MDIDYYNKNLDLKIVYPTPYGQAFINMCGNYGFISVDVAKYIINKIKKFPYVKWYEYDKLIWNIINIIV